MFSEYISKGIYCGDGFIQSGPKPQALFYHQNGGIMGFQGAIVTAVVVDPKFKWSLAYANVASRVFHTEAGLGALLQGVSEKLNIAFSVLEAVNFTDDSVDPLLDAYQEELSSMDCMDRYEQGEIGLRIDEAIQTFYSPAPGQAFNHNMQTGRNLVIVRRQEVHPFFLEKAVEGLKLQFATPGTNPGVKYI